eukprot:c20960_g1_i1 orf=699-4043(-)
MDGLSELEALQRYRRDRHELLDFLLSSSVLKKVVLPPGAVSLDDIDMEQVSVDYVIECAKQNGVLELSEAIKKYHDDLNLPPVAGSGLGGTYFLVTNPDVSGPPPSRVPPSVSMSTPPLPLLPKAFSLRSTPSQQLSVDDMIDDFEDNEDEDQQLGGVPRRHFNDASDLVLGLPPFATGLSDDDLRETSYEVLLASVGAAGGLVLPPKEKKEEKKSKYLKKLTSRKSEKYKPVPVRAPGLVGLLETMRTQMEISEAMDRRTREGLLHAAGGRVGKRMDTLLIPLELLCSISSADFSDRKAFLRWEKRQLNVLEEGLLNHPSISLESTDRTAAELRTFITKIEEAEMLPSPAGPAQHAEALKAMRGAALALAERAARGDQTGEVCHWADGYHLNVRLYERLLCSAFDVLDEGKLVEEVEEIIELLKSTWRVLGITQAMHDTCYTWVLFRQFVLTGELDLLQHAVLEMKRIASDGQRSPQERFYMKGLRIAVEGSGGMQELTFMQSLLGPIKEWADKRLGDYHLHFPEGSNKVEALVTLAVVAGRLIADENDQSRILRMTSTAEMAAVAKQAEDYIWSSIKAAYERAVEEVDAKSKTEHEHPLALLAEDVQALAKRDAAVFAPILSRWHPHAVAISASLLHSLYRKELMPFLDGVSLLTDDVTSVLPAADSLEQCLMNLVASVSDDNEEINQYKEQMTGYQVEVLSSTLIMRWVNVQLSRISEWTERTLHQERWLPLSNQQRHAGSIVEVFRIIEEIVDQFFKLKLPMRVPVLKGLMSGFDNAFQLYSNKVVSQLGNVQDLIPPVPALTRYKKDSSIKAFTKKKIADPRLPDDKRTSEINALTVSSLCVRLNTLHYILSQVDVIEDNTRLRWAAKRPQDNVVHQNKSVTKSPNGNVKQFVGTRADELSVAFDGTRKSLNTAIDKTCEFTGTKVIFWDMRESFIDGLYRGGVAVSRVESVVNGLDSVLGQICEVIVQPLRDRVVLGLLQASVDGTQRVLLDGGPSRFFAQSDANMLEADLKVLKDFFIADGDGLTRGTVENATAPIQQILTLYSAETFFVIDNLRHASEQMASNTNSQRGVKVVHDADSLLRVLCHRVDNESSVFLKKQYKLPKSSG